MFFFHHYSWKNKLKPKLCTKTFCGLSEGLWLYISISSGYPLLYFLQMTFIVWYCSSDCHIPPPLFKGLVILCPYTRSGCWRCGRHHCGLKWPQGYSGDCPGEQRRQCISVHLCPCPGGTSCRLCDFCWAADSQKSFHCPHLRRWAINIYFMSKTLQTDLSNSFLHSRY